MPAKRGSYATNPTLIARASCSTRNALYDSAVDDCTFWSRTSFFKVDPCTGTVIVIYSFNLHYRHGLPLRLGRANYGPPLLPVTRLDDSVTGCGARWQLSFGLSGMPLFPKHLCWQLLIVTLLIVMDSYTHAWFLCKCRSLTERMFFANLL